MTRIRGRLDSFLAKGRRSGGFTRVPNILLRRAESLGLSRSQMAVLVVMLSLRRGDVCCVSIRRLAHDANLSERMVKNCIRDMELARILEADREPFRFRRRRSNRYDLRPLVELMERSLRDQPWEKHASILESSSPPRSDSSINSITN